MKKANSERKHVSKSASPANVEMLSERVKHQKQRPAQKRHPVQSSPPVKSAQGVSTDYKEEERALGNLAMVWRTNKDNPSGPQVAEEYCRKLRALIKAGWRGELDVDAELPESLMPQEYLKLFT